MASLTNVSLSITSGATSSASNVNVTGTLGFDASEVGKTYRLEIKLFGEDKADDNRPSSDAVGDDELYTFRWGIFNPYKTIVVTAAGTQTFSETRSISAEKLDEDSGTVKVGQADINTPIFMPRADELYARAVLSGAPVSARSQTITTPGV